jgi:hypothetical protein
MGSAAPKQIIPLRREGLLAVGNGPAITLPPGFGFTLTSVAATLDVAPTTTSAVVHVLKNGTNVQTVTFAATDSSETASGLSLSFAAGDTYALRIDSVDSGATAAGLSVSLGVAF